MRHLIYIPLLLALSSPALSDNSLLVGVGFVIPDVKDCRTAGASLSCDEDTGFKVTAGWEHTFNEGLFLGLDASYRQADADLTATMTTGSTTVTVAGNLDFDSLGLALRPGYRVNNFAVYGLIGYHRWDIESIIVDEDGSDLFYGAGVEYQHDAGFGVRIEYERMQVEGDRLSDGDIDFFGASAIYSFSLGGAR